MLRELESPIYEERLKEMDLPAPEEWKETGVFAITYKLMKDLREIATLDLTLNVIKEAGYFKVREKNENREIFQQRNTA